MKKLRFKTKGENLATLTPIIKKAKILPLYLIQTDTLQDIKTILPKLKELGKKIIIRSSASNEDTLESSQAGAFLSIANVDTSNEKSVLDALESVKKSMGGGATGQNNHLILAQPMLQNPKMCGVAFSVDKDNGAPYFCIDYDDSGDTSSVTAGTKSDLTHIILHRNHQPKNPLIAKLIEAILELEDIFDNKFLDIEFAFAQTENDKDLELYILQVRPLIMQNKQNLFDTLHTKSLQALSDRIDSLKQKHPHILGDKTIFGVMPDWNPAEIIGLKPKRLAISLYKELVTDNIWAYQRDNYGYRNLRSHPLMHSFLGAPYIDVRLSFNSFIPKNLDETIANKLVNYYLDSLCKNPHLHDKVEFEIVLSCYDLNLPQKLHKLKEHDFNQNELKRIEFSLLELTNNILDTKTGLYLRDLDKVNRLQNRTTALMQSSLGTIDKIYWLIEDCKRFGTLPFAGVARAAFVAMQILNSLVEIGFFTANEKEDFLLSLNTVSKELAADVYRLSQNQITKEKFITKYGHLRAGTYNILSPSYQEAFEEYFSHHCIAPKPSQKSTFKLDAKKSKELDILLKQNGLYLNAEELFAFLKIVIEGREMVKFKFTKTLSIVLDLIATLGEKLQITKQDLAHLDIHSILSLQSSLYEINMKESFLENIEKNKKEYEITSAIKLPPVILNAHDVFYFESSKTQPNFITTKTIVALTASENDKELENKIILIHSADPGYDFLFTKNIAGLITCYGGANSHMAIRCSEMSLPAVIGVGEERFSQYKKATKLRIDSLNQQVFVL
ncbi:PEP-utilizing enzyme [Helicobacter sp. 11S02596-1]|uniref:PEP-utilizing enzyme n=1 Tax=Helicobacter sp. 11S02596-1 TaxID=1476194 RepID=UPI000BA7252A|nr:PEP-utilizing enzyme [Helicobacter sp. 11S02596-1]